MLRTTIIKHISKQPPKAALSHTTSRSLYNGRKYTFSNISFKIYVFQCAAWTTFGIVKGQCDGGVRDAMAFGMISFTASASLLVYPIAIRKLLEPAKEEVQK